MQATAWIPDEVPSTDTPPADEPPIPSHCAERLDHIDKRIEKMQHLVQHAYDFIVARNIEIFVDNHNEDLRTKVYDRKRSNYERSKSRADKEFDRFKTDLHRQYTKGRSCPKDPQADPHIDLREHFKDITNHARNSIDSFMFDAANIDEYHYDLIPEFQYQGRAQPKEKAGLDDPLGAIVNLVADTRFEEFCKEFKELEANHMMETVVKPNLDKVEWHVSQLREQSQLNASFKYQIHRRQNELAIYFHEKTKELDVCKCSFKTSKPVTGEADVLIAEVKRLYSGYNWNVRSAGKRFVRDMKMVGEPCVKNLFLVDFIVSFLFVMCSRCSRLPLPSIRLAYLLPITLSTHWLTLIRAESKKK